jgi:hypothetical protein
MGFLFRASALFAMALPMSAGVILQLPLDPNYLTQLPFPYVAADTGVSGPYSQIELNKEFPQYNYAIVPPLVGYFDPYDPAKDALWTVLRTDIVIPDTVQTSGGYPPICIGQACNVNPQPTCTGPNCGTPPPCTGPDCGSGGSTVPEPAAWTAALIGLTLLGAKALRSRL